jgi:hypothetical protein
MKGVIFAEFVEMVEETWSLEVAEAMFESLDLPSGGVYTSVGTYDHQELVAMVLWLSQRTGVAADRLFRDFGRVLFGRLANAYPEFFEGAPSALDFLELVEDRIHVEVRKLYPDAELPRLKFTRLAEEELELIYESTRPFADLAEGLITGCAEHFGQKLRIARRRHSAGGRDGVTFSIALEKEAAACCS